MVIDIRFYKKFIRFNKNEDKYLFEFLENKTDISSLFYLLSQLLQ